MMAQALAARPGTNNPWTLPRVLRSVAMLTGHKTEGVYTRHAIVCEADLDESVRRWSATRGAEPAGSPQVVWRSGPFGERKGMTWA